MSSIEQRVVRLEQTQAQREAYRPAQAKTTEIETEKDRVHAYRRYQRLLGLTREEQWLWKLYYHSMAQLVRQEQWDVYRAFCRRQDLCGEVRRAWEAYFSLRAHLAVTWWFDRIAEPLAEAETREACAKVLALAREEQAQLLEELDARTTQRLGEGWEIVPEPDREAIAAFYVKHVDTLLDLPRSHPNLYRDTVAVATLYRSAHEKVGQALAALSEAEKAIVAGSLQSLYGYAFLATHRLHA